MNQASQVLRRLGGATKTGLAGVGVVAVAAGGWEMRSHFAASSPSADDSKSRVLVIPFHKLQLVERKQESYNQYIPGRQSNTMEVRELVDLLHKAADDGSISAVYGIFGHGGAGVKQLGYAQLEEIREALSAVKTSLTLKDQDESDENSTIMVQPKPLYAYADTFASLDDPANKEYYLASAFTDIHLQKNGELNLLGLYSPQFFLKDALEKYGIKTHVFKHGNYKTAPNMFTNRGMTSYHRQQVERIQKLILADIDNDVSESRGVPPQKYWGSQKKRTEAFWKAVHDAGSLPADAASSLGLIRYLPRRSPLVDLLKKNKEEESKQDEESDKNDGKLIQPHETNFEDFVAEKCISIQAYAKEVRKAEPGSSWLKKKMAQNSDANKSQIALLNVDGMILSDMANKLIKSIRKIGKSDDFKCVVVRVNSGGGDTVACESIHEELKALKIPVIFSFGDVAASGGYYIASEAAERIFCSRKTITGSIGVFGVRMDLTGLAYKYGVNIEGVSSGDLSGTYTPLQPMTWKMKRNVGKQIDRTYAHFKSLVASGRNMKPREVEKIAQGKVWTGEEAKAIGLVDEIGGLYNALEYARKTHGGEQVVTFPERRSIFQQLLPDDESKTDFASALAKVQPSSMTGIMAVSSENDAIRCLLSSSVGTESIPEWFFWD